jgi:dTDP-4-dehydrorhamnose reductase
MKILITGDTGLLGANLCFLWRKQYDIIGVSRGNKTICGIRHISLDLLDTDKARGLIQAELPDIIVHTAALVSVEECEKSQEKAALFNTEMVKNIVNYAKEIGAYFIHISTDAFYEGKNGELCDENNSINLNNTYIRTKYKGEQYALAYDKTLCLRTNIFGCNFQEKLSFSEWILHELKKGNEITMFTDVLFSPIFVNDLAAIISQAISNRSTGLYNAGGTGCISKHDFAVYLKEQARIATGKITPISVKDFSFTAWRSSNMSMDSSKIQREISVEIPNIEQGIMNYLSVLSSNYHSQLRGVSK